MLIESEMVHGYIPPAGPRGCAFPVRKRGILRFTPMASPHYASGTENTPKLAETYLSMQLEAPALC